MATETISQPEESPEIVQESIESLAPATETPEKDPEITFLMNRPEMKDYVDSRKIREEDLAVVARALTIPVKVWSYYHNRISQTRDDLVRQLTNEIASFKQDLEKADESDVSLIAPQEKLAWAEVVRDITEKYDWQTAWGLEVAVKNTLKERAEELKAQRTQTSV